MSAERRGSAAPPMNAEQWFEKRRRMAEDYGVPVGEVPAEVVWYVPHPEPPITDDDRRRGEELAQQLGLNLRVTCSVCGRILVALKSGVVRSHGPRKRLCPGSNRLPVDRPAAERSEGEQ